MTHGDKAKAKTAKSSQASAAKKTSPKAAESGGKGVAKERDSVKAPKIAVKSQQATPEKGGGSAGTGAKKGGPAPAKDVAGGGDSRPKADRARGDAGSANGSFSNPVIANAFRHAVKKYPNAFRKLTD